MKNLLLITGLMSFLVCCQSTKQISKGTYIESISKPVNGIYTKHHYRKGWLFIDQLQDEKIINREVYLEGKLMYRYPIRKSELTKSEIHLLSGKSYLEKDVADTLRFLNPEIPVMNRHVYAKGGILLKLSDSLYLIKSSKDNLNRVIFCVSVFANMDEIKNTEQFVSDSLVLPIK